MREIKCVVSGDPCAGTRQAIMKFVYGERSGDYDPTIEDSYRKHLRVGPYKVLLNLLDTADQSKYAAMRKQYSVADVIIIMYSVTNLQSFENVRQYHDTVCRVQDSTTVPFILAGMRGRPGDTTQVTYNEGLQMAADIKAEEFFECSAQTGDGIDELFDAAAFAGLLDKDISDGLLLTANCDFLVFKQAGSNTVS